MILAGSHPLKHAFKKIGNFDVQFRMMKKIGASLSATLLTSVTAFAQPIPPPPPNMAVPLDSLVILLLGLSVVFAIYKHRKLKDKATEA